MFKAHNLSIEKCFFCLQKKITTIMKIYHFVFSRNILTVEGRPSSSPLNIALVLPEKAKLELTVSFVDSPRQQYMSDFQGLKLP